MATPWKLADHPRLGKGKVVGVVVLDGWGEAPPDPFNCIHVADTHTMDALKKVRARPDQFTGSCACVRVILLVNSVSSACVRAAGCSGAVEADQSSRDGGGAAYGR
jgi:hypothetical protein